MIVPSIHGSRRPWAGDLRLEGMSLMLGVLVFAVPNRAQDSVSKERKRVHRMLPRTPPSVGRGPNVR